MTKRDELLALAERCEKATGPCGELEAEIWLSVTPGATHNKWSYVHRTGRECTVDETRDRFGHLVSVPRYTEYLDAAMTLVPGGLEWSVSNRAPAPYGGRAYLHNRKPHFLGLSARENPDYRGWESVASDPVLSLCAAALRAQAEMES